MPRDLKPHRTQRGLTLIELMIAMALGLLVISVVLGVFINTNRNFRQDEMIGRMQENARYAMRVLAQDVSMIGFWGYMLGSGSVSSGTLTAGTDCGLSGVPWAFVVTPGMEVLEAATEAQVTTNYSCIVGTEFEVGTDVFALKRVEGDPLDSLRADAADDGTVFLRTNGVAGTLIQYSHTQASIPGDQTTPSADMFDWRYLTRIYHIQNHAITPGDGIPTLYRMGLSGTNIVKEGGGVAQGIEDFRINFGIDNNNDGIPEIYQAAPTPTAVTARVYVLARTITPDPGYNNAKSYQLGDVTRDIDLLSDGIADGNGDNFRRRVFVTTVKLRNPTNQNIMGL
ncbi:MAG: PilW family protein [Gammaproteobacteria bacterium]|nr:PilW family protein [Gammaproteobacteria bacterium]